jgi:hypothetical protein
MSFRFTRKQIQLAARMAKPRKFLSCEQELGSYLNALNAADGDESKISKPIFEDFQAGIDEEVIY